MRMFIQIILLCTVLQLSLAFSKYGRSCKDIGCPSSQVCVMAEDPCSYYNRDECGSYPTCKDSSSSSTPSCATHVCPPTQECRLDNGTPKCMDSRTSSSHAHKNENTGGASAPSYPSNPQSPSYPAQNPSYPAQNPSYPAQNPSYPAQNPSYPAQNPSYPAQNPSYPAQNPSYPAQNPSYPSGGSLYPSLSTPRPSHGSSYPGYPGYPSQQGSGGYGSYPNYHQQGGYPQYNGYPQGGYSQNGYPQYPNYQNQNRHGYGSNTNKNSGSNPIVDKITDQLKTIGAGILKNALNNALSGNRQ